MNTPASICLHDEHLSGVNSESADFICFEIVVIFRIFNVLIKLLDETNTKMRERVLFNTLTLVTSRYKRILIVIIVNKNEN